jgi:WD40 repeat protein
MPLPLGTVELRDHGGIINSIVPLPDHKLIATASSDVSIRIFAAATGDLVHALVGHEKAVFGLAALGGDMIASGAWDGELRVWNARTGRCTYGGNAGGAVLAIAALGAGRFVAGADGDLVIFEHCDGHGVAEVRRVLSAHASHVRHISTCGTRRFATASSDKTAAVWDAKSLARLAVLDGHLDWVNGVAMDERRIVTCSDDSTVHVYDAQTFSHVRVADNLHSNWVYPVALVDGDHMLTASWDKTVCISNVRSGAVLSRFELPFDVYSAAVTWDGRVAAAGDSASAVLLPAPAEAAHLLMCHNAAARPGLALRALCLIETGAPPSTMRRALSGRRV